MGRLHPLLVIALVTWPYYLNDFYVIALQGGDLRILWSLDLLFFLFIPCTTLFVFFRKNVLVPKEILQPPLFSPSIVFSGIAAVLPMLWLFQNLLIPFLREAFPDSYQYGYDFPPGQPERILLILYASFSAGVLEEFIFRGMVYQQLRKCLPGTAAPILLSCLLFGLIHWCSGTGHVIDTFLWAIPLQCWTVWRKNLTTPMICHTLYDLIIFSDLWRT